MMTPDQAIDTESFITRSPAALLELTVEDYSLPILICVWVLLFLSFAIVVFVLIPRMKKLGISATMAVRLAYSTSKGRQDLTYLWSFIGLGCGTAIHGAVLPVLASNVHLSVAGISSVLSARGLGWVTGSVTISPVFDHVKNGHYILGAAHFLAVVAFAVTPFITHPALLAVDYFLAGAALGIIDSGAQAMLLQTHTADEVSPFMQALHSFFGVGAMVSPTIFSATLFLGISERAGMIITYISIAAINGSCGVIACCLPPPQNRWNAPPGCVDVDAVMGASTCGHEGPDSHGASTCGHEGPDSHGAGQHGMCTDEVEMDLQTDSAVLLEAPGRNLDASDTEEGDSTSPTGIPKETGMSCEGEGGKTSAAADAVVPVVPPETVDHRAVSYLRQCVQSLNLLSTRVALSVAFFNFVYIGAEIGLASFATLYGVSDAMKLDLATAVVLSSVFLGLLAVGRVLSIGVSLVVTPRNMLAGDIVMACSILLFWTIFQNWSPVVWISVALCGLSFASIYAAAYSFAHSICPITGKMLAITQGGACSGEMLLPVVMGLFMDYVSPKTLPAVILVFCTLAATAWLYMIRLSRANSQPLASA